MKKSGLSLLFILVLTLFWASAVSAQAGAGESPLPTPTAQGGDSDGGGGVPQVELSGAGIAALVAVISSVALAYIPGLAAWWGTFPGKREALGLVGLLVAVALVGLHYAGAIDLGLSSFGWRVVWQTIEAWLAFSGAGQLMFTGQKLASK